MAAKPATSQEQIGRQGQRYPDDVLTPEEGKLLKKAELEMRQGKYVTLAQLHCDLAQQKACPSLRTLE